VGWLKAGGRAKNEDAACGNGRQVGFLYASRFGSTRDHCGEQDVSGLKVVALWYISSPFIGVFVGFGDGAVPADVPQP
jgi:hypothetical protein